MQNKDQHDPWEGGRRLDRGRRAVTRRDRIKFEEGGHGGRGGRLGAGCGGHGGQ